MKIPTVIKSTLVALFAAPLIAWSAPPILASRFGTVSYSKNFELTLNARLLENPYADEAFLPVSNRLQEVRAFDVILLSGNIIPNCPQYQLLILSVDNIDFTPVFGTCDIRAQITKEDDAVIIRMKTQLNGEKKLPVTFVFKDGHLTQKERIPFWPQGYIEK